jgi:hypothetical protein
MSAEGDGCVAAFCVLNMALGHHSWSPYMKPFLLTLFASVLLMSGARSHDAEYHLGQWIGTWQSGETSGSFDLDLARGSDGALTGNIDVSTNGAKAQEYAVDLRHVSFEGDHFTAVFVTPGKSAQVVKLSGTLSREKGSGEWVAHKLGEAKEPQATATASESGTWELEKHDT